MKQEISTKPDNRTFSIHVTQALKGIAILSMLFHHLFAQSGTFEDVYGVIFTPFTRDQVNTVSSGAVICVSMFVFLTGYGMLLSLRKRSAREQESYVVRRYLKLMVSFQIVFIASLATCFLRPDRLHMYFRDGKAAAIRYILTDALGFSTFAGTPGYNETWWYISFAVFLIFLMPIVTTLVRRYGIAVVVLAGLTQSFGIDMGKPIARFALALTLGAWLADRRLLDAVAVFLTTSGRRVLFMLCMFFLSFGGFAVHLKWNLNPWANAFVILTLVLFLYVLIDLCHVRLRLLEFLGVYSMNIFLIHTLVYERYFTKIVYAPRHFVLVEFTCLALSLAAAIPLSFVQKAVLRKLKLA